MRRQWEYRRITLRDVVTLDDIRTCERGSFYRTVDELMTPAISSQDQFVVAAAIWHLLQMGHSMWYQTKKCRDTGVQANNLIDHLINIRDLLMTCWSDCQILAALRGKEIESWSITDFEQVSEWFESFQNVLGPTGAAKALHFIAPDCFPPWDSFIARGSAGSGFSQDKSGYWDFIEMRQEQCRSIKSAGFSEHEVGTSVLRALDEVDYRRFTQRKEGRD